MPVTIVHENEYNSICKRYKAGETQQSIADAYGVSRERIRQILKEHGITGKDSIRRAEIARRHREARERYDSAIDKVTGITRKQRADFINRHPDVFRKFYEHRHNAIRLHIPFNITLHEYFDIWDKSGKFEQRGLSADSYVFTRIDFSKPYTVDNCQIITLAESSRNAINQLVHKK